MSYQVKTFIEHQYYLRESNGEFSRITHIDALPPIDQQVEAWVKATQHVIVHPGTLSVHTTWYGEKEAPFMRRCITLGLAVLYQRGNDDGQPTTTEPVPFPDPDDA